MSRPQRIGKVVVTLRKRVRTRRVSPPTNAANHSESLDSPPGTRDALPPDMFIALAGRIKRQVGVVNPVGRYYDRCFVCLVESIDAPVWLRTLGLRVACSLRRPMEVGSSDGQRLEIHPDIGVGIVHLTPDEAHLDDVARMVGHPNSVAKRIDAFDGQHRP